MIHTWVIERGNIFVWVWTILQWNLMAHTILIDPLALHNIAISEDHFVICHDSKQSLTKKVKSYTRKLSIVTLWTRFYVLPSVWVSGYR